VKFPWFLSLDFRPTPGKTRQKTCGEEKQQQTTKLNESGRLDDDFFPLKSSQSSPFLGGMLNFFWGTIYHHQAETDFNISCPIPVLILNPVFIDKSRV